MFINREISAFIMVLLLMGMVGQVSAQESIGGPYTPDSATVLLMHFNDNFKNASDQYEVASPEIYGNLSFLEMLGAGDLGMQVQLDNDSPDDKSHIQIPDTTALDLTGSWTIEYWVNLFKFGIIYRPSDWRYLQTVLTKPGDGNLSVDNGYAKANYYMKVPYGTRDFVAGYFSSDVERWMDLRSPSGSIRIGEWFHVTFIRDTSEHVIIQMVHQNASNKSRLPNANNDSLELVYFDARSYIDNNIKAGPKTSEQPLFIGTTPEDDTLGGNLDGFMDELRISNVVRNFAMPPVITELSKRNNQPAGKDVRIEAKIETYGGSELLSRRLHYKIADGNWQSITMMEEPGGRFLATIPGQPIGTNIKYWVSAENRQGMKAVKPARGPGGATPYYEFTTWRDGTQVLGLTFEGMEDGEPPADRSIYESAFNVSGEPTYPQIEGRGQVLRLSADKQTSISTEAGVLSLPSFAIDLKFQASDSLPGDGQRLLYKAGDLINPSPNYELRFTSGGRLTVSTTIPGLTTVSVLPPHKTITDTSIAPDQWYRLWFTYQPDTMRAQLFSLSDSSHIGGFTDHLTFNSFAQTTKGPLRIGTLPRVYGQQWFNGMVDDVRIYNYVPEYFKRTFTNAPERPELPNRVKLKQNYPNPFNPSTSIVFSLPEGMDVELSVYDALGRRIRTLVDGYRKEGPHKVTFNADGLASGVYFYRLETEDEVKSRRMLLVK